MDSVEIVLCWEESLGIRLSDSQVAKIRTPADSVTALAALVPVTVGTGRCLNQIAFHRVRSVLEERFRIRRDRIRPHSRFSELFPKKGRRDSLKNFQQTLEPIDLSGVFGFSVFGPGRIRISDVVTEMVARHASRLVESGHFWSLSQLRSIVRASVHYVVGVEEFADDDDYVRDIGID